MLVLCLTYAWLSLEGAWHWQGANILLHAQWSCSSTVEQATKISNFNFYFSPFFYFPEHYYLRILQPAFYIHLCTIQDFIGSLICLDRRYWNSKKLFLVKLMVWFMFFFLFLFLFLLIIWKVLRIRWWNGLVSLPESNWSWCLVLGDWVSKFYQLLRSIESVEYQSLMTWPRPWPRLGLRTYVYTFLFFFFFFLKPSTRFKKFYNAF